MKSFHSLARQQFRGNIAAHDFVQLVTRQPRRQFIFSSKRLASSGASSPLSTTTATAAARRSAKQSITSNPLFRRFPRHQQRRPNSTKSSPQQAPPESARPSPDPTPNLSSPSGSANLSLTQRLRKLSREYGWSALGVYFALSALDFPFCFAAVRIIGTERIGHWEHVIVDGAKQILTYPFPEGTFGTVKPHEEASPSAVPAVPTVTSEGIAQPGEAPQEWSWGVEAADEANNQGATIWTQLALAYAIHKSFIFLRVPLTAAVTPKVVKVLRGWGWDIGKRKPKVPKVQK